MAGQTLVGLGGGRVGRAGAAGGPTVNGPPSLI